MFCRDDADALARDPDGLGDLQGIVVHQHNVRGLDGGVAAHGAHGDADVRAGQHRRVVDAVADKGELVLRAFSASSFSTSATLSPGQQLAAHLVDAQLRRRPARPRARASPVSMTVLLHAGAF